MQITAFSAARARCTTLCGVLVVMVAPSAWAQDSRVVKEPVVPPACVSLPAALIAVGDTTIATADEGKLDSPRIQQAIDGCRAGQSVRLVATGNRRAFLSGPLQLRTGVTLVIDSTVIVFASRDPRVFDVTPGACGILSTGGRGCHALIRAERASHSGVMGAGTIDGRGWSRIGGTGPTWWELAEQARDTKFSQNNPRLIQTLRTDDFTLYRLTLKNAPNFHVVFDRGDGFTAWGVRINTPRGARNTDGIDPASATNVSILYSSIHTGDDNIAIKAGTGTGSNHITVAHSHFYNGHGVSVGSETNGGASAIVVSDVTFDGTDNALRIKSNGSRGGLVENVRYENVCIRNVKAPVYMDSHYSASPELDGTLIPVFRNIVVRDVRIIGAGTITLDGYDASRPVDILFDRVIADTPAQLSVKGANATVQFGPNGSNVVFPAAGMQLRGASPPAMRSPELAACEARLVPFPGGAARPVDVPRPQRFENPVLSADFSDPDVIRAGRDFWMTASSFGHVPGLPILHSSDLVHWEIVNYAIPRFADAAFNTPQHGNGVWAPSIREHDGWFWIFYGDPDRGIYMTRSRDPRGAWTVPTLVQAGKGLIDPSPLWDDDGRAFLVHAYARSRAGIKHKLVVHSMRPDGSALLDTGTVVFEDSVHHPTAEGPKFYKRDGWYWIFAPAGGVATGWQLALRSQSPRGPYEVRTVLAQGSSTVNGPHQGAWVSLASGEAWFLHFQDRAAYGRVVHLQPMRWASDGWPVIGDASAAATQGIPVASGRMPNVTTVAPSPSLQMSDEFSAPTLGRQWQWQANPQPSWGHVVASSGTLQLNTQPLAAPANSLWDAPNLLLQKFPAEQFEVITKFSAAATTSGDRFGVVVFGRDYAWLGLRRADAGWELVSARATNADRGATEVAEVLQTVGVPELTVRVRVQHGGVCHFAYSIAGAAFVEVAAPFVARQGVWVGAKFGVFASRDTPVIAKRARPGHVSVDYVRVQVL